MTACRCLDPCEAVGLLPEPRGLRSGPLVHAVFTFSCPFPSPCSSFLSTDGLLLEEEGTGNRSSLTPGHFLPFSVRFLPPFLKLLGLSRHFKLFPSCFSSSLAGWPASFGVIRDVPPVSRPLPSPLNSSGQLPSQLGGQRQPPAANAQGPHAHPIPSHCGSDLGPLRPKALASALRLLCHPHVDPSGRFTASSSTRIQPLLSTPVAWSKAL